MNAYKVCVVQFRPAFGEPVENRLKASRLLASIRKEDRLNIIVLPEMCFSGYCFESREEMLPFAENATTGPTFEWAAEQARRLSAYIAVGYPEIDSSGSLYNSQLFIGPSGELVKNYRKHFLYDTDKKWASEGPGFFKEQVVPLNGVVSLGICMDINPKDFVAPFNAFGEYLAVLVVV
mmetsp:Transcript_24139/g.39663  ORF Transcript_24139/g.39663 Transcript_24139/m.39663 type:complete len:178 (-) Transcript_24139:136-669(-)